MLCDHRSARLGKLGRSGLVTPIVTLKLSAEAQGLRKCDKCLICLLSTPEARTDRSCFEIRRWIKYIYDRRTTLISLTNARRFADRGPSTCQRVFANCGASA